MAELVSTEDVVSEDMLCEILGIEPDESPSNGDDRIPVCAGEWRKEPDGRWRFWENQEW